MTAMRTNQEHFRWAGARVTNFAGGAAESVIRRWSGTNASKTKDHGIDPKSAKPFG
jgi:hypothetical protein